MPFKWHPIFLPISEPELLDTACGENGVPPQAEDARIFTCDGKIYVIYNDNIHVENPPRNQRRDMYVAQLTYENNKFTLATPVELHHAVKYETETWQKNWVPFEWHKTFLLGYSLAPHEILFPKTNLGVCKTIFKTPSIVNWKKGELRGGTPATLVDGEYLAFFHSAIVTKSEASQGVSMHHYYMGAYTFNAEPPFQITKITTSPIIADGFYTQSSYNKRVVFPGGYIVEDPYIYVVYGKDDNEIWIVQIDKAQLKNELKTVPQSRSSKSVVSSQ